MNTRHQTPSHRFLRRYKPQIAGLLVLLSLLPTPSGWRQPIPAAFSQTADGGDRFSLKFQEVAPGIEHGQATRGHASKDETTGPWLVNALRIDLSRASIKIVRALDAGVGMETLAHWPRDTARRRR